MMRAVYFMLLPMVCLGVIGFWPFAYLAAMALTARLAMLPEEVRA